MYILKPSHRLHQSSITGTKITNYFFPRSETNVLLKAEAGLFLHCLQLFSVLFLDVKFRELRSLNNNNVSAPFDT